MVDADGATRIDDLARLEEVMNKDSGIAAVGVGGDYQSGSVMVLSFSDFWFQRSS